MPGVDLTVSQTVGEIKEGLALAPGVLKKGQDLLDEINSLVLEAVPGSELAQKMAIVTASAKRGVLTADVAIDGAEKLLHQFGIPLALVGGLKLQGTGEMVQAGTQAYKGLQSTLTDAQKAINTVIPAVQALVIIAGVILYFFPSIGAIGPVGGLTVAKVVGILGTYLNIKNSTYPDAPRAQLVALPK